MRCSAVFAFVTLFGTISADVYAAPQTTGNITTIFGPVTLTFDPTNPACITATVANSKPMPNHSKKLNLVAQAMVAGNPGKHAKAYCSAVDSFSYCRNGITFKHVGPWRFFRSCFDPFHSGFGQWVTAACQTLPAPKKTIDKPCPGGGSIPPPWFDGPKGPGNGVPQSGPQVGGLTGNGLVGLLDSPGVEYRCPPPAGTPNVKNQATICFLTLWYSGNPPKPWTGYKWGYTICWNLATKATTITMKTDAKFIFPGSQEWKDEMDDINDHVDEEGYDEYTVPPVEAGKRGQLVKKVKKEKKSK